MLCFGWMECCVFYVEWLLDIGGEIIIEFLFVDFFDDCIEYVD